MLNRDKKDYPYPRDEMRMIKVKSNKDDSVSTLYLIHMYDKLFLKQDVTYTTLYRDNWTYRVKVFEYIPAEDGLISTLIIEGE